MRTCVARVVSPMQGIGCTRCVSFKACVNVGIAISLLYLYARVMHFKVLFIFSANVFSAILTGDEVKEGDIRIVRSGQLWQGIVEIYLSGVWGTIYYYYGPTTAEAYVVCRQLGYNTYSML